MHTKTKTIIKAERRQQMYDWLIKLRDSGKINMWGAAQPLATAFCLTDKEARDVLVDWMQWMGDRGEE